MRKRNQRRAIKLLIALLAVCLISFGAGRAYAKYIREQRGEGLVKAQEFYFTSDYLTTTGETYILNADTESISFQLRNYDDSLRWSESNVFYDVTLEEGSAPAQIHYATDASRDEDENYYIPSGSAQSATIQLAGLQPGKTYTVCATGNAGYQATLQATFTVDEYQTGLYKHVDTTSNDAYVLLTVWSEDIASEDVTITYPAGLVPDNTNPEMTDAKTNGNSFAVAFKSYQSRTYRFFKEGNYSGDFSVKLNGEEATPATPK